MGNKTYWYLLSLQHLLEANSLKEVLQNSYLIWILQIAQGIFSHRMHSISAIPAIIRAVQVSSLKFSLSFTPLWAVTHRTHRVQQSSWKLPLQNICPCSSACQANLRVPRQKTTHCHKEKQLFITLNGLRQWQCAGFICSLCEICFSIITSSFPSAFCFSKGFHKWYFKTAMQMHVLSLVQKTENKCIKEIQLMAPSG